MSTADDAQKPTDSGTPPETSTTQETTTTKDEESLLADDNRPADKDDSSLLDDDTGSSEAASAEAAFGADEVTLESFKSSLGEDAVLDDDLASGFLDIINSAESRADMATKLAEFYSEAEAGATQAIVDEWNSTQKAWKDAVRADPEVGGDKFNESLAKARTVVETYAKDAEALKEVLKLTGAGNNVEVVRFLNRVADAIPGEAKPVEGTPAETSKSYAERIFGSAEAS